MLFNGARVCVDDERTFVIGLFLAPCLSLPCCVLFFFLVPVLFPCHSFTQHASSSSSSSFSFFSFYDPRSGRILLDGRDIRTLNLRELHSKMALVAQVGE